ncbi:hypothetical protein Pan216_19850 [Planctomycetes bacterium Pan216]|uniref:Uncharacterized protein n=1 Tax=Kolteria novifilia TaxID=2527975 RepID=A0A518B2B4_9BACT|nr:hypothetical protein Pan216_19850 [Planctomycetes bacterium Pan216]
MSIPLYVQIKMLLAVSPGRPWPYPLRRESLTLSESTDYPQQSGWECGSGSSVSNVDREWPVGL